MAHSCELPDDLYGLTLEEARQATQGTKARVTNKKFSFDVLKGFQVKNVGRLEVVAPSQKRLDQALFWIKNAARKKAIKECDK